MTLASRLLPALVVLAAAAPALANGRPPATSTINFKRGDDTHILAGMTFGAIMSDDRGATWHWVCEKAIKYGGVYDPYYAYTADGTIFATTFDGSLVNRDGCRYESTTFGNHFVSTLTQGANGAIFMTLSQPAAGPDPGDSKIYRSDDNGATFPVSAEPGQLNDWWDSIKVSSSDPQRVYLTGYRLGGGSARTQLLFRSTDGGASYTPMSQTGLTFTNNSTADVVGIHPTNPDILYLSIDFQTNDATVSEAIYRSTDGGASWAKIFEVNDVISFIVRKNGDLLVGTPSMGTSVMRAPATGTTWTPLANAPHIQCFSENEAGELWACTQNYDLAMTPGSGDGGGIMKTTDYTSWSVVMRYEDILGPLPCDPGTLQYDECQVVDWCILRAQLMVEANPTCCRVDPETGYEQGCPVDSDGAVNPGGSDRKGCCDSSNASGAQAGLLAVVVGGAMVLRRRKRRH